MAASRETLDSESTRCVPSVSRTCPADSRDVWAASARGTTRRQPPRDGCKQMTDSGLRGRVALVTGANHGIGAATARGLASAGCDVFIHFLRHRAGDDPGAAQRMQDATQIVEGIRSAGGRAESWEADLADPASIPALFDRVETAFGPVEILVNNAAVSEHDTFDPRIGARDWAGRPTPQLTAASHERHFSVNTRAVALMMAEHARRGLGTRPLGHHGQHRLAGPHRHGMDHPGHGRGHGAHHTARACWQASGCRGCDRLPRLRSSAMVNGTALVRRWRTSHVLGRPKMSSSRALRNEVRPADDEAT